MLGALAFLPSLAFVPHLAFLIAIAYALGLKLAQMYYHTDLNFGARKAVDFNFIIIFLIVLFSLLNNLLHYDSFSNLSDLFPFYMLVPFTVMISYMITPFDLKIIILLSAVEAIAVMVEYYMGVSSFFPSLALYTEFDDGSLLYFTRPLGLSTNSSMAATKFVLSILLIDFVRLKGKFWFGVKLVLVTGVFLTFNRSSLLVIVLYLSVTFVLKALKYQSSRLKYIALTGVVTGIFIVGMYIIGINWYEIIGQLTRNKHEVELTGRELIWANYIEFIRDNLVFGNGSFKLYFNHLHAHNSYLQVIATNGLVIGLLYFYLVVRNMHKNNFLYLSMILLFSFFQYGVFWGISMMDIILFMLLFRERENITTYRLPLRKQSSVNFFPSDN